MMKKSLFLVFVLLGFSFLAKAQSSLSNFNQSTDSCYGGATNNTVNVSVYASNFTSNLSVSFYWGDGSSSVATASQGWFYTNHTYATPGTYTVSAILFDGTTALDTISTTVESFCKTVRGFAYKRMDNNCVINFGEPMINSPFEIQVLKAGVPVDTIYSNGSIYKKIASADMSSVFTLHLLNVPAGMLAACPTTDYNFKFDTLDYQSFSGFDFGFDCDPSYTGFDLSITGLGFFRPVANSYIYINPRNSSCLSNNGTVTLNLNPKYTYGSASITPTSISGNTISWDLTGLNNTSFPFLQVVLNPVGTLTIGDTIMNTVTITPMTGDVNPANNTFVMIDSIRASFDPNEKHVNPVGDIIPGQRLTYTINFENLGNDTAFNIHVMDTLSSFLDANTLKLISSSHAVNLQTFDYGTKKVLRFDFANIMLADASDLENNKGFVTFEINAKSNLAYGDIIENTASIYFDINPAVVTNTTQSKYPSPTGILEWNNTKRLYVYPNPGKDKLFIEGLDQFKQVHVLNTLGQLIMTQNIKQGTQSINIANLPSGIYFIKASRGDGNYMQKFVKE